MMMAQARPMAPAQVRPMQQQPQQQPQVQPQQQAMPEAGIDEGVAQIQGALQTIVAFVQMLKEKQVPGADQAMQHLQGLMTSFQPQQQQQQQMLQQQSRPMLQQQSRPMPQQQQRMMKPEASRPMGDRPEQRLMMANQRPMVM